MSKTKTPEKFAKIEQKDFDRIEYIDVTDLKFDPKNPRMHSDRNLEVIEDSVKNFGFARSIVIDEHNQLLAGEGATRGSMRAGLKKVMVIDTDGDTVVAVRRTGLTDDQKDRLKVVDNRANELSEWNNSNLAAILTAHADDAEMLHTTGFSDEDVLHLLEKIAMQEQNLDELFKDGGGLNSGEPTFKLAFTFTDESLFNSVKEKLTKDGTTLEEGLLTALNL